MRFKPAIYQSIGIGLFSIIPRMINLSFPFGDYDEGVYIATVRSILHGFPLISQTYTSQFPLFAYIATVFYTISQTISTVRLFPILMSVGLIVVSFTTVRKYIGTYAASVIGIYLALNSIFLSVSRTFQLDIPWTASTCFALYFLLLFNEKRRWRDLVLSALCFSIAILMKVNITFIIVLLASFWILRKDKAIYMQMLAYALIFIILAIIVIQPGNIVNLYHQAFTVRTSMLGFSLTNLIHGTRRTLLLHEFPIILLDFASIFIIFRKNLWSNRFVLFSFIWLAATSIIFLFYNPLFIHHLVFFIFPSVLVSSVAIEEGWKTNKKILVFIFSFLIILYASFNYVSDLNILFPIPSQYDNSLQTLSTYIDIHTRPTDYVITDEQLLLYLSNRNTPPNDVDTSYVRIQSHSLTSSEMIQDTQKFHVKVVVLVSSRLSQLHDYVTFLQKHYSFQKESGGDVYLAK